MKKLRDVWSAAVINGKFGGSLNEYALKAFKAKAKLSYLGKPVTSMLEMLAIPDNQLYVADETTEDGLVDAPKEESSTVENILHQWEGKELSADELLEKIKPFADDSAEVMNELYNKGLIDYRMDKIYVKPEGEVVPKQMEQVKVSRSASYKAADVLFNNVGVKCPNCAMAMRQVQLIGSVGSWYCPNCRHCDFDDKSKTTASPNMQTVDHILEFRCLQDGNCEIAN